MSLTIDAAGDFLRRHIGPRDDDIEQMLETLGYGSLSELMADAIPESIRSEGDPDIDEAVSEQDLLARLTEIAGENKICRSFIGMGYSGTILPPVIQRNILENPGWYTQYTPYQAEIAQGRLEALLNFQTMIIDLTGLEIANASLLDEGTAAAEAMTLFHGETRGDARNVFFVSELCHPQTIEVVKTRAEPVGVEVVVGNHESFDFEGAMEGRVFGVLLQYPASDGAVIDYSGFCDTAHDAGALVVVATDLLSLTLLRPPGEFGADVAVGSSQRFGVPPGYGGPHAAFMATRDEFKRKIPGRIIGVSVDADGNPALRMALQTREQHIRREKATSNICTAQVLLAVIAGMYAVYHGPQGLTAIARRIHALATVLAAGLEEQGHAVLHKHFFDTLRVRPGGEDDEGAARVLASAEAMDINLRDFGDGTVGIALDERTAPEDVDDLLAAFAGDMSGGGTAGGPGAAHELARSIDSADFAEGMSRTSPFMEHPVFHQYHSETEMLRYMHRLEARDLSLNTSMIPLGSCTMKL
ncbi:MAG: glycine dehydrogenase (aminomethyl-transferring), partial [Gemmatimonadota bacterium]